jgi:hypothetical protein
MDDLRGWHLLHNCGFGCAIASYRFSVQELRDGLSFCFGSR